MPEKHILSKSTFMYGCQCTKRLHLHKYRPELKNPVDERVQYIKDSGSAVGQLAQQLFPGGVDASPADTYSYQESVVKTQELIAAGVTIIYEAVFQYEGVLCALDILVKEGDAWHAYEVKGAGKVKPQHVEDAAFQYYVITNSGIALNDISIVHLNMKYIRQGELDIHKLFAKQSILKDVVELQSTIQQKIYELKHVLTQPEPVTDIGRHCLSPYACDYIDHCWAHIPKVDSVFDLDPRAAWELYAEGYTHLDHIPLDYPLSDSVLHQVTHYRSGEPSIHREEIRSFINSIQYPVHYLDFETIMPSVPEFEHAWPFQQIPFQFSLHVQHSPEAEPEHYEFLGDGTSDPREALVQELVTRIGPAGTVLCYNKSFEIGRNKDLANIYEPYRDQLLSINQRTLDLMTPFRKRWYYHPEFKGSYSIKSILPVLCPDLRYNTLTIQEGQMAGIVYAQLKLQDEDTAALQRGHLLAYCKMDTLAMVRVLGVLKSC